MVFTGGLFYREGACADWEKQDDFALLLIKADKIKSPGGMTHNEESEQLYFFSK